MNLRLTKPKLSLAVAATALLVPTSAYAAGVFDDVADDKFYAAPVEWAFDNDITTGKSPTLFAPDDNVTRGESVTFLKRYNDNIVEPGLDSLRADLDETDEAVAAGTVRLASDIATEWVDDWDGGTQTRTATIEAPTTGILLMSYAASFATDAEATGNGARDVSARILLGDELQGLTVWSGLDFSAVAYQGQSRNISFQRVATVEAGAHEVSAALDAVFGADHAGYIYDQSLTVLFIPLDGEGATPTLTLAATGGDSAPVDRAQ